MSSSDVKPRRFRIALSFAGEKREFVEAVARVLAARFGEAAILYDKFHEAEFAVYDLGLRLPKLFSEESDLIVPILCPNYDTKRWTGWEWVYIYGLLTRAEGHRVMPCRFEHATVNGLSEGAAFIELDGKTPQQTAILILERLALNEGKSKDHYIVPATLRTAPHVSIPNNLPRLQPFFGRQEELRRIAEALDPDNRTWGALIDGPGGMGKTSLAVRAAYDCAPGQFQRIVFVSVKDRELDDDGVRELGVFVLPGFIEMLNELARELGQPQIAKAPENQRIRLLLDALRPANALLILDNLESLPKGDRDRLFTFVKRLPQGCKAILTSRRRIGSGSEELILEQLSLNAALETLADLSRRNPLLARTSEAERIALYEQTAGKPLLLRWVAGQLGRGSCRTFSDASRFLLSCPPDNDPLEFIFGDLVKEFTTLETATLCALTYFSVPAKVEHIQALTTPSSQAEDTETRVPPESDVPSSPQKLVQIARDVKREFSRVDVETALSSLANRSLVVPDQEEKAFTLVPMVAEFLRNKRPETIAETGNRLEKRAFSLAIQNGGKKYARFHIIEDAWPTLAASLPRFISGSRARLKAICAALHDFLDFSGRWDEWLWLTQEAESKARLDRDWNTAGYQAYLTGYIHYMRGEALMVMKCASRATEYWAHAEPFWTRQSSILSLNGHLHRLTKNYPAAMAAYSQVINLAREHGSAENVATGLSHLAHAERESGDLDAAEHHYRESLELIGLSGSKESAAVATGRLADIALQRENWRGAEKLARAALELSETVGRKEIIAFDCRRLAEALLRQDRKAEALPLASRAVRMFAVLRSPEIERARATLNECEG